MQKVEGSSPFIRFHGAEPESRSVSRESPGDGAFPAFFGGPVVGFGGLYVSEYGKGKKKEKEKKKDEFGRRRPRRIVHCHVYRHARVQRLLRARGGRRLGRGDARVGAKIIRSSETRWERRVSVSIE
jgi:hypothetical protein